MALKRPVIRGWAVGNLRVIAILCLAILNPGLRAQQSCSVALLEYQTLSTSGIKIGSQGFQQRHPSVFYLQNTSSEHKVWDVSSAGYHFDADVSYTTTYDPTNYIINPGPLCLDSVGCRCTTPQGQSYTSSGTQNETAHSDPDSYTCSITLLNGVWSPVCAPHPSWLDSQISLFNSWYVPPSAISDTTTTGETSQVHDYHYTYGPQTYVDVNTTTLSRPYTTDMLIGFMRDDLDAQWNALPANTPWASGNGGSASLNMDWTEQKCGDGTEMRYRFNLPYTERDVSYYVSWDEVTTYSDGSTKASSKSETISGNGTQKYSAMHTIKVPGEPCTVTVQNVNSSVVPSGSGGSAPGNGSVGAGSMGGTASGCTTCGGNGGSILANQSEGGVSLRVDMGRASFGQSAGTLTLQESKNSKAMYSPALLSFGSELSDVQVIRANSQLRQVKTPQALADIFTVDANKYEIRFYLPNQVGGPGAGGIYSVTGNPYAKWTVENPDLTDANYTKVRITETRGSDVKAYDYVFSLSLHTWLLTPPGGFREEETVSSANPISHTRQESTVIRKPGGADSFRYSRTYNKFAWGERLTQESVGPASSPLTTTYNYSASGYYNGSVVPLDNVLYPHGAWEKYVYENGTGRRIWIYSSLNNQAPTTDYTLCRATQFDYTKIDPSDDGTDPWAPRTTIQYVLGKEVSRSYLLVKPGERREIRCQTAGATWNDANNLVTTNIYYTTGSDTNRLKSVAYPDGTMSFYSYSENASQRTIAVSTGQPNAAANGILNGTQTVTVIGNVGQLVSLTVSDISNGALTTSLVSDLYSYSDDFKRSYTVIHLDTTTESVSYSCCGLDSSFDRDGVQTLYSYDVLNRQVATTRLGIMLTNVLDAAGNVLASIRIGTNNSQIVLKQASYDSAATLLTETNALLGVTTYSESIDGAGQTVKTIAYPNTGTRIETYAKDGALVKVTGTAVRGQRFVNGVELDSTSPGYNRVVSQEIKLDANGNDTTEWTKTYSDMLGRQDMTLFADATSTLADNPVNRSYYNNKGQLWKQVDPDGVTTLFQYNPKGEVEYTATDLNRNGVIDFGGLDRISRATNDVTYNSAYSKYVRRTRNYVWSTDSVNASNLVSMVEVSTDGLSSWQTFWRDSSTSITNKSRIVFLGGGLRNITNTAPDGSFVVNAFSNGLALSVTRYPSNGVSLGKTSYGYDEHGRLLSTVDARNGSTSYGYNNADQVTTTVTPSPGTGQAAQTTSVSYDSMLRPTVTTQPDGAKTTNDYYLTGDLKGTSGSRTYPVTYGYDQQGRMTKMTNWSNFSAGSGARVTTWQYDANRGFLSNKLYDGGVQGPSYTYTPGGRLKQRTWARTGTGSLRIAATYTYGIDDGASGNDYGDLLSVVYSNDPTSTPTVTYAYDRRGRQKTVTQGSAVTSLTYNDFNQLLTEAYTGAGTPLNGFTLTSGYDTSFRRGSLSLNTTPSAINFTYGYDTASRLTNVSDGTYSAGYTYLANSPLLDQVTFKQNTTPRMTTTRRYDFLNRLQSISSGPAAAGQLPISYGYQYNDANQRRTVTLADGGYWVYQYDTLGQVTSGKRYFSDGTPVPGQQFEYGFDDIGNRGSTKAGGDATGMNLRSASYATNTLNQYSTRTVPNAVDVLGRASAAASVTVNSSAADFRRGEYFQELVSVVNNGGPVWQSISVSTSGGGSASGNIYVPQATETYGYDLDGNQTNDGRWSFTWDAENRLISMQAISGVPSGAKMKLDFSYDWKGRRIQKVVSTWNGSAYVTSSTTKFLYDGWNLVAEVNGANAVIRSYLWGLDLSGSFRGAGGVGGLLAIKPASGNPSFVAVDGNGNVGGLVDATTGTATGGFEYGPFGEPIRLTPTANNQSPFRFSTKYTDDESDLVYYGYRYYCPSTGRWLSRDPIGERGGINLQAFVRNNPICRIDYLGLADDDRGVSERYCDAAKKYPQNKWLACACGVSRTIDGALAAMVATTVIDRLTTNDPDYDYANAGIGKWFVCMRSCMVRKWEAALKKWEGQPLDKKQQSELTPAWNKVCNDCQGERISETDCCKKQVQAEQGGFEDCTKGCGKWQWGNNFPVNVMPGWDKSWDFNDLQTRINYGLTLCCSKNAEASK